MRFVNLNREDKKIKENIFYFFFIFYRVLMDLFM